MTSGTGHGRPFKVFPTALESNGLLHRGKIGKAFVYSPAPDLAGKLGL